MGRPSSTEQAARVILNYIKECSKYTKLRIRYDLIDMFESACDEAFKKISNEWNEVWKKSIQSFYTFPTRVYIRHGQSRPGTKTGKNLYNASETSMSYSSSFHGGTAHISEFSIMGTPGNLQSDNYTESAETVFSNILDGYRFLVPQGTSGRNRPHGKTRTYTIKKFTTSSRGLNSAYSGKLGDIAKKFEHNANERIQLIVNKEFSQLVKTYAKTLS